MATTRRVHLGTKGIPFENWTRTYSWLAFGKSEHRLAKGGVLPRLWVLALVERAIGYSFAVTNGAALDAGKQSQAGERLLHCVASTGLCS